VENKKTRSQASPASGFPSREKRVGLVQFNGCSGKRTNMGSRGFAALFLARLFIMPMRTDFSHNAFFVHFLLQSAQRLINRLATSDFDFGYSTFHLVNTCLSRFVVLRRDHLFQRRERKTSEWGGICQTEAGVNSPAVRRAWGEISDLLKALSNELLYRRLFSG